MPTTQPAAQLIAEVLTHCAERPDEEVLGVVVGDRVQGLRNRHPDPRLGFEVDPLEWARWEDVATVFFHSHPNGATWLSALDRQALPTALECWVVGRTALARYIWRGGQWHEIPEETPKSHLSEV